MVRRIKNETFPSNTYLISTKNHKDCILIDPGLDQDKIKEVIEQSQLYPKHIICTHAHFDHVASVSFFQQEYGALFHIHTDDVKFLKSVNFFLKVMKIEKMVSVPTPDNLLEGFHNKLSLGFAEIDLYNYPGHTNGSCIIEWENNLFTGDTLYLNGLGLNKFPGENKELLKSSLRSIVDRFDDRSMVYPGHGDYGFLGNIRLENSEMNSFIK